MPVCAKNFTTLPGDGTVGVFRQMLGENVGRTAINLVLSSLGLNVSYFVFNSYEYVRSYSQCLAFITVIKSHFKLPLK